MELVANTKIYQKLRLSCIDLMMDIVGTIRNDTVFEGFRVLLLHDGNSGAQCCFASIHFTKYCGVIDLEFLAIITHVIVIDWEHLAKLCKIEPYCSFNRLNVC